MIKKDEVSITFGEKLKSARKRAGLTQEQPAEQLFVSRQAITKWESDKGLPDIENLKQLSKRLDVRIDYLLDKSITDKKFSIGNFSFVDCGILPRLEDSKK